MISTLRNRDFHFGGMMISIRRIHDVLCSGIFNTCEIYNNQLTDFVCRLRDTQNSMAANNPHISSHYQIVILMRNTSLRMFTSQQTAELIAHVIDLSGWFEAYAILLKKIEWYDKAGMKISGIDSINSILNDFGECKGTLKGLHFKISMLFNYNKRVISYFLVRVLSRATNAKYIELYDYFWNKKSGLEYSLAKFAGRSIIYRLILDELREDDFFKCIIVQKKCQERTSLGYARKILTILYDHYLNNLENNGVMGNVYMGLGDIIIRLFEGHENPIMTYFDDNNSVRRKQIADVIYYMNYYDGRRDNWLQFVDLQYNIEEERVEIADPMQLNELIRSDWQNIRLRITTAGKAYLFFMVYYFEYFACKSLNSDERQKVFGDNDIPPLLSAIPKRNEILTKPAKELLCVKIIDVISREALLCIAAMNDEGNNTIDFRYKINKPTISHQQRIVNSHRGYIDNFIECLNSLYRKEANDNSLLQEKLDDLIVTIRKIRNKYRVDYITREE